MSYSLGILRPEKLIKGDIRAMNLFHNLAERYHNEEPTSGNIESNELDEEILLACRTLMRLPDASTARPANARTLNEDAFVQSARTQEALWLHSLSNECRNMPRN
jgi:hypothetical protein